MSCDRRMSLTDRSSTAVGGMSSATTSENATYDGRGKKRRAAATIATAAVAAAAGV